MKLHLPKGLRVALLAVMAAAGSVAYGSTTYSDLTTPDYFEANANVYNTGKGTFYLETPSCDLNLTLTLNLNKLNDFQTVHDYANGGYYSPFVTWTYNNNPGATYGMTDVARGYSGVDYDSGFTGYWAGKPWSTGTKITTETLWNDYADADGNVTLTINNTPNGTTNNVVVTAVNSAGTTQTLYSANGLRSQNYTSQHITSFTVNMNYVTSVTLNTGSTLDSSNFTPPKDYSIPFQSQRTDGTTVGRIMFLGDSITHGVQDMSYRWDMFKTFVDNGIENEIAGPLSGYHSQPLNSDFNGDFSTSQYGGETFVNAHYAQSSGRTHNMLTASGSVNALGNSTGVNYGGVSSAKTGKDYNADTYVMMMGTNDILSDGAYNNTNMPKVTERLLGAGSVQNGVWVNANQEAALIGALGTDPATSTYTGKWGTMGQIIDNMKMDAGDTMYIVSIPTWGEGRTGLNGAASYVAEYNVKLEKWVDSYNASHTGTVKYVDVNKGLVNVTRNGQFLAPDAFFRTAGGDYIHPNEQGALIIAGNLAQGMGLAGRTAGLTRSGVGHEGHDWQTATATINLSAGQSVQAISNAFTIDGGYTIDFGATFGDGSANGWLANTNALSVTIGDGTNSGTLKISEGYISWGDKLLYCQDNHLTTNDNLRVAYTQGNNSQNIGSGYYVWLGDKLIGQALTAGTGNTTNGVTLTSTGGSSVITGLSYTNTAYAPSTNFITAYDNGLVSVTPPSDNPDVPLTPMPSHNGEATHFAGIDFTNAGTASGQFGTNGQAATGDITVIRTGGATASYIGAVGAAHNGNVTVKYNGVTTSSSVMLATNSNVSNGNITTVLDGNTSINKVNHFNNSGDYSFLGSFSADVSGALQLEVNNATLSGGIQMGVINGVGTISGGTKLIVNEGASVGGDIFGGGSANGTTNNGVINKGTSITINGGTVNGDIYGGNRSGGTINGGTSVTITGGTITGSVNGGSLNNAGSINGGTSVTVEGNKASIGGNITADKVSLKNVTNSGHTDGFDQYGGTITAANLELNKYTADEVKAQLVGEHLHVTGNSSTNVSKLNLTACDITVDAGSSLTLSGMQEYGHTTSYTGNITIAKGTTFSVENPTEGVYPQDEEGNKYTSGANGFKYTGYVYDVLKPTEDSTGRLFDEAGQPLGLTTNLTLQGTGKLEGAFFVYKADTGILSAFEKILTDTCYINTGVLVYAKEAGAYGATESLQLNNGANLVMADNLADGVNIQSNGGTVTLLDKVKVDASRLNAASDKSTILAGSGTFALAAGSKSLGTGLSTDAEEWKGTILMSTTAGQTIKDISAADLSALAPNADAWVEMNNVSGYFAGSDQTFTSNIRLMGDKALAIVSGYQGCTYTFAGDIAGDGTFSHTYDGNSYKFQGDISDWVGAFETAKSSSYKRATGVTLEGKATTVNAALHSNAGSALNLTLGDITNGASAYTFNNEVVVNNLSASGKNIVLGAADDALPGGSLEVRGTATMAQLTLQAGTSASFTGDTTMTKLVAGEGTTVAFGGSTVQLSNDGAYKVSNVEAAKATLSFAAGANVRVSGDVNIGTLQVGGNVSIADNTNENYVQNALIHNLSSESGAHLTLAAGFQTSLHTTYTLGAADTDAATPHFDGVIELKRNNNSTGITQLILANTDIAADAVIKLNNADAGKKFGVGIAASTVKVQGIQDVDGSKGGLIFSGSDYDNPESTVRTLEITGSGTYTTSATLGAHLNLVISGAGTQTFNGDMSAYTGDVTVSGESGMVIAAASSSVGTITTQSSSLTFNGGTHSVTNLRGNDVAGGAASAVNLTGKSTVTVSGTLTFGARGEVITIDSGSNLILTSGNAGLTIAAAGETPATFKTTATSANGGLYTYNSSSSQQGFIEITNADVSVTRAQSLYTKLTNTAVKNTSGGQVTVAASGNTLTAVNAENGDLVVLNSGSSEESLKTIAAVGGNVTLRNAAAAYGLNDLNIGSGHSVTALTTGTTVASDDSNVATIKVAGTLTAAVGSTLNANLVMQSGSTLHLAEGAALTMGCSVTLENGTKLELGADPYAAPVVLYNDVESLTLGGTTYAYEQMGWYDAAGIIISLNGEALSGDYVIGYWNGTVSFAEKSVPEPATATLSLLALAALAARRRRR